MQLLGGAPRPVKGGQEAAGRDVRRGVRPEKGAKQLHLLKNNIVRELLYRKNSPQNSERRLRLGRSPSLSTTRRRRGARWTTTAGRKK